jgi:hypothetical protein
MRLGKGRVKGGDGEKGMREVRGKDRNWGIGKEGERERG